MSVAGLCVAWIFIVYLGYYTVHKPLTARILIATLDRLGDLATLTSLLLLATALGRRLLRRVAFFSLLEELTLAAGLGLGIFSVLTLGLGPDGHTPPGDAEDHGVCHRLFSEILNVGCRD